MGDSQKRVTDSQDVNSVTSSKDAQYIRPELSLDLNAPVKIDVRRLKFFYDQKLALFDVTLPLLACQTTAVIGPSGSGKSTFLRALNRMNDLIPNTRTEGKVMLDGENIYSETTDVVALRQRVGMVFHRPSLFPTSIFENVAYGLLRQGKSQKGIEEQVERSLRSVALWEEVKDRLKSSALSLSSGQQQHLCIARLLAVQPEVLLMQDPCSALDPVSTLKIEELITQLTKDYTIVIVTHNMQQAARISQYIGFFLLGRLVEYGPTSDVFEHPQEKDTEDYVSGRFG